VSSYGPITRIRLWHSLLGVPLHDSSAFHVGGLLIDTGPPATEDEMVAWARSRSIEKIVLTHHHEDHTGGAAALLDALRVPLLAPAPALPMLREGLRLPLYRRVIFKGAPRPFDADPLPEILTSGDLSFRVVPTPGHALDHVCLFEESHGWLFSGDLFVHERVNMFRRIEDLAAHMDSLRRVLSLSPTLLVCSQSGFFEDARGSLERKIRFWEDLAAEARSLRIRGLSNRAITRRLVGREGPRTFASLGEYSKIRLIEELLRLPPASG